MNAAASRRRARLACCACTMRGLALAAPLLLSSCLFFNEESFERAAALRAARVRWETAAPASYSMREIVACFCLCPQSFTVFVNDDQVAAVADIEPIEGAPPEELEARALECARTVSQLFGVLASHVETADQFRAEYDPVLGYPTLISIDPDKRTADEEIYVRLLGLESTGAGRASSPGQTIAAVPGPP